MNISKQSSYWIIGLALFSMFFGSGNLIFPLFIGQAAETSWTFAALGFLCTAVFVPFLGVIAMVLYHGDYVKFFECLGGKLGFLLIAIVLTVWIPLGSGPRCIALAYSSMATQFDIPSIWIFSAIYSIFSAIVIHKKSRMLDILGYFLTPLLLLCLGIIIVKGITISGHNSPSTLSNMSLFFTGITEGYNTMDLIASFFFSASVIGILKESGVKEQFHPIRITLKASIVGISLLGAVYVGLVALAGYHADIIASVPKDQLLAFLAAHILGSNLAIIPILAILLACFSTSVALVTVYTEFLQKTVFKFEGGYWPSIVLTVFSCFVMSLFGLSGITAVTGPVLEVFYPLLLALIVINILRKWLFAPSEKPQATL